MFHRFIPPVLAFFMLASVTVQAEPEAGSAQLPAAARRVLEDAEKAVARNRKAFATANEEAMKEAEASLKQLLERLTKEGRLEEALATKNLLGSFREQVPGLANDSLGEKATDTPKRKRTVKMPARRGKPECDEVFGFTDEERVKEWWEFNQQARNHQLGTDGIRLNNGGTMKLRVGLAGDFEFGVIVQQHTWHDIAVLDVAGIRLDIGRDGPPGKVYQLVVLRQGDQMHVNNNGRRSVMTIPAAELDRPQYPAISYPGKIDVKTVGIKAMRLVRGNQ